MKQYSKLEELLFQQEEYDKKNQFNTESLYQSIGIDQKEILPEDSNIEIEIRNKLSKIISSLKSFNINLSNDIPSNYMLSNRFICQLLDAIIELIWKLEEEYSIKISYVSKIANLNLRLDEASKKMKKLNTEINEYKKSQLDQLTINSKIKDKESKLKNKSETEMNELKTANKKLILLTNSLKIDIKKKENEINKFKEKLKKFLSVSESSLAQGKIEVYNQGFLSITPVNDNLIFSPKNNPQIEDKIKFLADQNESLLNVAKNFKQFIDKICKKIYSSSVDQELFLDLVKIKDNLFSMHLIGKNLEEFESNFKNNIAVFEKIINNIIDSGKSVKIINEKGKAEDSFNNFNEDNNTKIVNPEIAFEKPFIPKPKPKKDLLGNFKKWSLCTGNENFLYNSASKKLQNDSRWYENVDQEKKIVFEYNKDNVIKGDSYMNSEHN